MQLICPDFFFNLFPLNGFLCQQTMSVSDCSLSFGVIFSDGNVEANGYRPNYIKQEVDAPDIFLV